MPRSAANLVAAVLMIPVPPMKRTFMLPPSIAAEPLALLSLRGATKKMITAVASGETEVVDDVRSDPRNLFCSIKSGLAG
jgi:hypothetical protein